MKKINANDPEIKKIMGLFAKQFQTVLEKYCAEDDETFETSFDVEVVELDFLRYVTYTETNNAYIITGLNIANIEADDLHDLPIPSSYNGKQVMLSNVT